MFMTNTLESTNKSLQLILQNINRIQELLNSTRTHSLPNQATTESLLEGL